MKPVEREILKRGRIKLERFVERHSGMRFWVYAALVIFVAASLIGCHGETLGQLLGTDSGSSSPSGSSLSPYRGTYTAQGQTCFAQTFFIDNQAQIFTDDDNHFEYAIERVSTIGNEASFQLEFGTLLISYPEGGTPGNIVYVGPCRAAYNWVVN